MSWAMCRADGRTSRPRPRWTRRSSISTRSGSTWARRSRGAPRATQRASGGSIDRGAARTTWTRAPPGRTAMTDAELWALWRLWLGVAVVIILVAAALLVTIWLTARRILAH